MDVNLLVQGSGIQTSLTGPTPFPFDLKRDLLGGSHLDNKMMGFLIKAYINKMSPAKEGGLVNWSNMSTSQMLTIALAHIQVNEVKNRQINKIGKFNPVNDQDVKSRLVAMVADDGFISPKEWEQRFPGNRLRR